MSRSGSLSIVVLGGGVAGMAATLALARDGHRVTLVERDEVVAAEPLDALTWDRRGIPHFQQAHAFTPRGRKEIRTTFPDVFDALVEAGAWDLDLRPKIRGGATRADDEELAYLAVRRPLIEWALRRAVIAETGARVLDRTSATGLVTAGGRPQRRVTGVETTTGTVEADLVVDAMGRRSPSPAWIAAIGGRPMHERSADCSIIYYTRYYRTRDGASLPDGPWIPSPRGDLGYAAFSTFPGDNGTFAALLAIPRGDPDLKVLRDPRAFVAAIRTMPALDSWTNADTAEPISDVLPMGSLRNTIRSLPDDEPPALGLISIGDALVHTNPVLATGLAFALIHARHVVTALRDHANDVEAATLAFDALARPEMEERYAHVSSIDDIRTRLWAGERIDYTHAAGGAYSFFSNAATGFSSVADGDVMRTLVRRNTFLDPLAVLDEDTAMQARVEHFYADLAAAGRPPPGPSRSELLEVAHAAVA